MAAFASFLLQNPTQRNAAIKIPTRLSLSLSPHSLSLPLTPTVSMPEHNRPLVKMMLLRRLRFTRQTTEHDLDCNAVRLRSGILEDIHLLDNPGGIGDGFTSAYFVMTDPEPEAEPEQESSSTSSSSISSTPTSITISNATSTPDLSDAAPADTSVPNSGLSASARNTALGIGIDVGIPVLAAVAVLIWSRKRRKRTGNAWPGARTRTRASAG